MCQVLTSPVPRSRMGADPRCPATGDGREKGPQNRVFRLPQLPQKGRKSWQGSRDVSGQHNPLSRINRREFICNKSQLDIPQPDRPAHPSTYCPRLIGSSGAAFERAPSNAAARARGEKENTRLLPAPGGGRGDAAGAAQGKAAADSADVGSDGC